jgi:hypothetical protein
MVRLAARWPGLTRGALRWGRISCSLATLLLVACIPPVRQFDLTHQVLTCEQTNRYAYRTLASMGFTVTSFDPAVVGRTGRLRGTREDRGRTQNVTVTISCTGSDADITASEDGRWLGLLEFKRGFYLAFTATAAQAEARAAAAREEAQRPLEQKHAKGLQVLLEPVPGLGAKLDFGLDLAAAGLLPVRVTVQNVTARRYKLDPADIVLLQTDGRRVPPVSLAVAVQAVADAERRRSAAGMPAAADSAEIAGRLRARLLAGQSVPANQTVKGYLLYPAGTYTKGRIALEDEENEETEGFLVEF